MRIYQVEVTVSMQREDKFSVIFSDENKALEFMWKEIRNYYEIRVYQLVEKDGRFYLEKTIGHLGGDENDI